jgi:tetratricopeptide (TPR) repeat protein
MDTGRRDPGNTIENALENKLGVSRENAINNEKDIDIQCRYGYAYENNMKRLEGWMRRYIGQTLLNIDDQQISEEEDWIKKAIEADKKNGMMWLLARNYAPYAELFKRKGNQSKAKENLTKAIEIYKECGADDWVEKAEEKMAALL